VDTCPLYPGGTSPTMSDLLWHKESQTSGPANRRSNRFRMTGGGDNLDSCPLLRTTTEEVRIKVTLFSKPIRRATRGQGSGGGVTEASDHDRRQIPAVHEHRAYWPRRVFEVLTRQRLPLRPKRLPVRRDLRRDWRPIIVQTSPNTRNASDCQPNAARRSKMTGQFSKHEGTRWPSPS
jgi:hypothetical protein